MSGCANPGSPGPLPLQEAPDFTESGSGQVPDRWWTAFNDAPLDSEIEQALTDSFTIEAAWQRLAAARAVTQRESAALLPVLDGFAEADKRWANEASDSQNVAFGLEAAYEVDLWGRIESQVEAAEFRQRATLADYQTAALTLSAEITRTWYRLAQARMELALVNEQVEVNNKVLTVLKKRFAAGQILSSDVLQQTQLLEATQEQVIVVESRIAVLRNLLAVLSGKPAQSEVEMPPARLPDLPAVPDTGLPSTLIERRPDIQRAFLTLQAADRDLASAVSDQYPRIFLTGSIQTATETPEDLFKAWIASLAGQVVAPIFDGGRRRAEVERTEAVAKQRLAEYGQTVLVAFAEVENALVRNRFQIERLESIEEQLVLARQTYDQLLTQYLNGVTDYLSVLTALNAEQRLQRDQLAARLSLVEFRIELYRALAGRFVTPLEAASTKQGEPAS